MFDWLTTPKYQWTVIDEILVVEEIILGYIILWIIFCVILAIKDWFKKKVEGNK